MKHLHCPINLIRKEKARINVRRQRKSYFHPRFLIAWQPPLCFRRNARGINCIPGHTAITMKKTWVCTKEGTKNTKNLVEDRYTMGLARSELARCHGTSWRSSRNPSQIYVLRHGILSVARAIFNYRIQVAIIDGDRELVNNPGLSTDCRF